MDINNPTQYAWFLRNKKGKYLQFFSFMFPVGQKYIKLHKSEKLTVALSHTSPPISYSLAWRF